MRSDIVLEAASVLKCPTTYLKIVSSRSSLSPPAVEILFLAHRDWLHGLLLHQTIPENFQTLQDYSDSEVEALLSETRVPSPDWTLLALKTIPVNFKPKIKWSSQPVGPDCANLTLPEIVEYINQTHFTNSWRASVKTDQERSSPGSWQEQVLEPILRLHGGDLPVIRPDDDEGDNSLHIQPGGESESECVSKPTNLVPLHCLILTNHFVLLIQNFQPTSVLDILKYSPAIISETSTKYLFILYQILEIYKTLASLGFSFGDAVSLDHFKINDTLHIQYEPPLLVEEISYEHSDPEISPEPGESVPACREVSEATARWCRRELSNLEYLLLLNREAGREFGQPNNHPVLPWVCDFSSRDGGLRDLTKSKFRLNKGDVALDLTFESGRHHVTEVLSEITYYTYKSRVTHKSILCKHVRQSWVPEEYPSSIQRLMAWSPDEAIPEFYTDPAIFTSIHPDLTNLGLPDWVEDPEEFCSWHRARLESEEVSRQLHSWIDLTFGYKLSGAAAVRNKNVCLSIADSHKDLRNHGVLQLFTQPHPVRGQVVKNRIPAELILSQTTADLSVLETSGDDEEELVTSNEETKETEGRIILPSDYNPLEELLQLETLQSFRSKSGNIPADISTTTDPSQTLHERSADPDLAVIGCLVVELYLSRRRMFLLPDKFRLRCELARAEMKHLPATVRQFVQLLLSSCPSEQPPPQLLTSPLASPLQFPESFPVLSQILAILSELQDSLEDGEVGEVCVTIIARTLMPVLPSLSEECLELVVPFLSRLLSSPSTAVISAWLLFDPVASSLGITRSREAFLEKICQLYMNGTTTAKHAKLYHRTFLLALSSRFRLKVFLDKFINPLIEAVGGYKDLEWDSERQGLEETIIFDKKDEAVAGSDRAAATSSSSDQHTGGSDCFSEGEVFAFDSLEEPSGGQQAGQQNSSSASEESISSLTAVVDLDTFTKVGDNAEEKHDESNISTVASESVIWLSQRLGPLLACRYLARNLLRMLALCYSGPEGVLDTGRSHSDQRIRVSGSRLSGDLEAAPVLDCLSQLVGLYGDSLVVVQFLPHCWDLVSRAKRRISPSLASSLLASTAVTHTSVSLLSDSVLIHELPHSLLAHILAPLLQVTTSRRVVFLTGPRARLVLLYKLLDCVYIVGLRIGEEMSRLHLTPLATGLLSGFDKLEDELAEGDEDTAGLTQLRQVLTPSAAFAAYVCFHQLLGGSYLESKLANPSLIKKLILNHQSSLVRPVHRPASFLELQGVMPPQPVGSSSFCGSGTSVGTGNMIVVSQEGEQEAASGNDMMLISKPPVTTGRHLRGNWLAYWEHELGKDERNSAFNFKQIKLQTFTGHLGSVRSLAVLDNENSFLSGGKDKTVRLWSVRNVGEGDLAVGSQSVFSQHRKAVFYVAHLPSSGHCVSCDGSLLLWDPFVMTTVREFESSANSTKTSFCAAKRISEPGHSVAVATSEATVRLFDSRVGGGGGVAELRVSQGAAGLIRSLGVSGDGHQLAVGHTSGYISLLDLRTGKLKTGLKAHDGEVLTLTNINKQFFVSTSLDQLASGWKWEDGRQAAALRAFPEPLHCVCPYEETEVIMGSTANRLVVQQSVETDSPSSAHKLKSDLMKGNLTQLSVLPLNKQLLLATDSGSIHLVC